MNYLTGKNHINNKADLIVRNLAVMNRIKNFIPMCTRKTLYNSLILPHLSYGVVAWGNTRSKEMKRLKIIQKRAARFITKAKYNAHTNPIFNSQNLLTIDDIFKLQCCKIYQKRLKDQLPIFFNTLLPFVSETHNYPTRQQDHIRPPSITLTSMQEQFLSVKVAKAWNNLPISIKQCTHLSTNSFTNKCHTYFTKQYPLKCPIVDCYVCIR